MSSDATLVVAVEKADAPGEVRTTFDLEPGDELVCGRRDARSKVALQPHQLWAPLDVEEHDPRVHGLWALVRHDGASGWLVENHGRQRSLVVDGRLVRAQHGSGTAEYAVLRPGRTTVVFQTELRDYRVHVTTGAPGFVAGRALDTGTRSGYRLGFAPPAHPHWVALLVYTAREFLDGTAYPSALSNKEVHVLMSRDGFDPAHRSVKDGPGKVGETLRRVRQSFAEANGLPLPDPETLVKLLHRSGLLPDLVRAYRDLFPERPDPIADFATLATSPR